MARILGEPEIGSELAPVIKVAKNMAAGKGIHDDDRAKALGFERALVPGVTSFAYITEMLMSSFGESWVSGGEINLSFIYPLYEGEKVTTRAVVRDKKVENAEVRLFLEVWAENEKGVKVAAGAASALLPRLASS